MEMDFYESLQKLDLLPLIFRQIMLLASNCLSICIIALKKPEYDDWLFLGSRCKGSKANWNCCSPESPCGIGEGDCDAEYDCAGALVCGSNNCPSDFPSSTYDCCEKKSHQGLLIHLWK